MPPAESGLFNRLEGTAMAAVLGRDVSRSLSPKLQHAAAEALGVSFSYLAVSAPDEAGFQAAVRGLRVLGAAGANVTIPFKRVALGLAQQTSAVATAIGAVNTLVFEAGAVHADNTDGPALRAVFEAMPQHRLRTVQILGAGGAARAAAWALAPLAEGVVVSARNERDAAEVAALAGGRPAPLAPAPKATLVVSSLPGEVPLAEKALRHWVDVGGAPYIYDLAYGAPGRPSALVGAARTAGLSADDGLSMLVAQAARSFCLWTGASLDVVQRAMFASVGWANPPF